MTENLERLKSWLHATSYDGIILGRRDNFKWITQKNENAVVTNTETGIAFLILEKDGTVKIMADSSDCPRMEKEQNVFQAECILAPWYDTLEGCLADYCRGKHYASDLGIAETVCVEEELVALRMQLNPGEVLRYREIGQICARAVEETILEAQPEMTEKDVAARLKIRCIEQGISPDCVLVGSDERILAYRHPVPTDKKIKDSLMVVLGGEKYGLNISLTRMVYFAPVPQEIRRRMDSTQSIFAGMQNLMRTCPSYREYFEKVKELYVQSGYPDEWKMHHQGGPTGYGCREFVVTPHTEGQIKIGQVYAWNPTIQGTKCEDTTYLTGEGIEIFTKTEQWPRKIVSSPYGDFEASDISVVG